MRTPMRRIRSPCCARAATGNAAAPPKTASNSRRSDGDCHLRPPARGASREKYHATRVPSLRSRRTGMLPPFTGGHSQSGPVSRRTTGALHEPHRSRSASIAARRRDRSALAFREKWPCFQFARLLRSRPSGSEPKTHLLRRTETGVVTRRFIARKRRSQSLQR
jgi:hypothetical protein